MSEGAQPSLHIACVQWPPSQPQIHDGGEVPGSAHPFVKPPNQIAASQGWEIGIRHKTGNNKSTLPPGVD